MPGSVPAPGGYTVEDDAVPPTIIVGMHRSGTTILARLLSDLGLFIGTRTSGPSEALFFLRLNRWLLREASTAWDRPEPARLLWEHDEVRELVGRWLERILDSPRAAMFLGWRRYLRLGGITALDRPWGWKDPRTTILLPLWLDRFPDARIVSIRRHGVDVADSLYRRHVENLEASRQGFDDGEGSGLLDWLHWSRPGWLEPRTAPLVNSLRSLSRREGVEMWTTYNAMLDEHLEAFDNPRLELRYEELLDAPFDVLSETVAFSGLDPGEEAIRAAADEIRPDRAFAYRRDEELSSLAETVEDQLQRWGYEA